jgi:hypothetical protein
VTDPHKLRPTELCRLLNSTPLGEVINERQLHRHRTKAGRRIGDNRHVDLVRYVAWLVRVRHAPKPASDGVAPMAPTLVEAAQGAAAVASRKEQMRGHGQKFTRKQEAVIAALLTEPTCAAAAAQAGVSEATVYRWLELPAFLAAYRQARRELFDAVMGRIQAGTGQAVETLLTVALHGRRESDRVRAAGMVLDYAFRGLAIADVLHGEQQAGDGPAMGTADVVRLLSGQLRQLGAAELPTAQKSSLTANLAEALLRAIGVDVLDKRLEALQTVLSSRKGQKR